MTEPMSGTKVRLIQSDDERPLVRLDPGRRYEVVVTSVVDTDLESIKDETEGTTLRPARLCGGRSTCIAIFETE